MTSAGAASRGRSFGLRSRFVGALALLIAIVLAGNSYVLVMEARQERRRMVEERAVSFSKLAVGPLCAAYEAYFASGRQKFREIVRGLLALNPEIEQLALYDVTGKLLFESSSLGSESPAGSPVAIDPGLLTAIRALEVSRAPRSGHGGTARFEVVVPYVEEWGRHRYTLVAEATFSGLRRATRAAAFRIGLWAVLALALGTGIAVVLARRSLRPVEVLRRGALDLAEGRLERRIALATGDEFESLAQAFNAMAERLQGSIAELESSNRALSAANLELTELDRLKSDLLANVSHELRTPLTAVQGYSEAMAAGLLGPLADAQREALSVVQRNLRRLLAMIEELLASARLQQGTLTIQPAPFDLAALAAEEVDNLRTAGRGAADLELEVEKDLPLALADRDRIAQVLDNLLDNALKFTPEGGRVLLRLRREGDRIAVEVRDTGIGMSSETLGRIFDRFYQMDPSAKRRYGGLGLGLAIARAILAAHGTMIEVESEPGRGSTFRFRLPLSGTEERGHPVRRALIVDGDPAQLGALAEALRQAGLAAELAQTAAQARERLRAGPFDVVVLSRLLPDADGFDLLREPGALGSARALVRVREREAGLARRLGAAAVVLPESPPADLVTVATRLAEAAVVESKR